MYDPNIAAETAFSQNGKTVTSLELLTIGDCDGPFDENVRDRALTALERGQILYFPELVFLPDDKFRTLFSARLADHARKNISYDPATGTLKGTSATPSERLLLRSMMDAFSCAATRFLHDLLPSYAAGIERGRASYRPVEIAGREYSRRKDDKLLHIDAFPSTPTRGRRILRLFSNVDPTGSSRIWRVGEPFEQFAQRFLPTAQRSTKAISWVLAAVGATRGRRTAYDQLMLGFHNSAKESEEFKSSAYFEEFAFPAGSSWLCFTDQVVHAATSGQLALEHTFYLDVEAMADPTNSPLRILERMTKRKLV